VLRPKIYLFTDPVLQMFPVNVQNMYRKASCSTCSRLSCLAVMRNLHHFAFACWMQGYVQFCEKQSV